MRSRTCSTGPSARSPVSVASQLGWINVAAPGRGEGAHSELATVLGYVGAIVVPEACRRITVGHGSVSPDGTVSDQPVRAALVDVMTALVAHA